MHQYIQVHRTEIREFYIQQEHCVLLTRQHVADGFDPSGVRNSLLQMGTLKTKGQAIVNRLNMRYQCARTTVFAALSDRCRQTDKIQSVYLMTIQPAYAPHLLSRT